MSIEAPANCLFRCCKSDGRCDKCGFDHETCCFPGEYISQKATPSPDCPATPVEKEALPSRCPAKTKTDN